MEFCIFFQYWDENAVFSVERTFLKLNSRQSWQTDKKVGNILGGQHRQSSCHLAESQNRQTEQCMSGFYLSFWNKSDTFPLNISIPAKQPFLTANCSIRQFSTSCGVNKEGRRIRGTPYLWTWHGSWFSGSIRTWVFLYLPPLDLMML